jgi:hypothetical protein
VGFPDEVGGRVGGVIALRMTKLMLGGNGRRGEKPD